MVAAQMLNNNTELVIYGIVTDGMYWQIGKLDGVVFTNQVTSYLTANLPVLYGSIDWVYHTVNQQIP